MTKATWGGKGLVDFCFHCTAHHQWEVKSGQERKQGRKLEAWADNRGLGGVLLAPHGLLLLSYKTQDHQARMALPTMDWALLYQSLIKKMPYSLALRRLWRHFLNWGSSLSEDSNRVWYKISKHTYWKSPLISSCVEQCLLITSPHCPSETMQMENFQRAGYYYFFLAM